MPSPGVELNRKNFHKLLFQTPGKLHRKSFAPLSAHSGTEELSLPIWEPVTEENVKGGYSTTWEMQSQGTLEAENVNPEKERLKY